MNRKSTNGFSLAATTLLLACGCSSQPGQPPVVDSPSDNFNGRVRYLVIHHTSENFAESHRLLTERTGNPVSSHYLIPEPGDETYEQGRLRVFRLVPESKRAWHAGRSYWNGDEALNDHSIGIEIVNRTRCVAPIDEDVANLCFFPDFPEEQLSLLFDLVEDILRRHPDIKPTAIVGHSDVAPGRKIDPGPRFPWQRMYRLGFGAWPDEDAVARYWEVFRGSMPAVTVVQQALGAYRYAIEETGAFDRQTMLVVRAFQLHFRPERSTGAIDAETLATLFALLEKYRPDSLPDLLGMIDLPRPIMD